MLPFRTFAVVYLTSAGRLWTTSQPPPPTRTTTPRVVASRCWLINLGNFMWVLPFLVYSAYSDVSARRPVAKLEVMSRHGRGTGSLVQFPAAIMTYLRSTRLLMMVFAGRARIPPNS